MKKTIEVALNLPLYQTFNYLIPEDVSNIKAGTRVEVPFGRKKLIGICLGIKKQDSNENFKYKLKHFNKIIEPSDLVFRVNYELPDGFPARVAQGGCRMVWVSHVR